MIARVSTSKRWQSIAVFMLTIVSMFPAITTIAARQDATPTPFPEMAAPLGLAGVALPDDAQAISAVFDRMPRELVGSGGLQLPQVAEERTPLRLLIAYGDDLAQVIPGRATIIALELGTLSAPTPDWSGSVEDFVALMTSDTVDPFHCDIVACYHRNEGRGTDDDLMWGSFVENTFWTSYRGGDLSSDGSLLDRPLFYTVWGKSGAKWAFSAYGRTPDERDAIVRAFVAAVQTEQSGTPVPIDAAQPSPDGSPDAFAPAIQSIVDADAFKVYAFRRALWGWMSTWIEMAAQRFGVSTKAKSNQFVNV